MVRSSSIFVAARYNNAESHDNFLTLWLVSKLVLLDLGTASHGNWRGGYYVSTKPACFLAIVISDVTVLTLWLLRGVTRTQ